MSGVQWCDFSSLQQCDFGHCSLDLPSSSNPPTLASQVVGTTSTRHHCQLIFVFLVEMGFRHVAQADLEPLASCDPPASVSQSAGITGSPDWSAILVHCNL